MFTALSFRFICLYPVPLVLCSRTERLYLWCMSAVMNSTGIWRGTFHIYGITRFGKHVEHNPGFHHRAKSVVSGRYFEGHSQPCDTQTTLVMSFFSVDFCHRKKCSTHDIQQWQWKMDRMPTMLAEKQVTAFAEPLAQLPWSYSVRVDSFAHLVLSMAASSAWRTCLAFRVAWRWCHTRPQTHVVIIWLDLHLG